MHFKKELDTTELLKWGIASLGAVIAFFLAQYTALQIEVAKIKKEALQEIVEYSPRARINYTNELQENRSTLQVRVYFVPKSKGELYIFPPALTIYDESGGVIPPDKYTAHDIGQFQGSFPPDEPYQITYNIELHESINLLPNKVKLEYTIQTANIDAHPMIWYSNGTDIEPACIWGPYNTFNHVYEKGYIRVAVMESIDTRIVENGLKIVVENPDQFVILP